MTPRPLLAALAAVVLLGAGPQDVAGAVAREIMSPFCPGVTLHDCPSEAADDLRREIVAMAERGMSKDEIVHALEAEYGPLAATPPNPLARALPWAVALAALAAGVLLARRFAARAPRPAGVAPLGEADRERVRRELERFRRQG